MTTRPKSAAPLILPLDPDLERRITGVLCGGRVDDPDELLLATLPPWLDGREGAKAMGVLWGALRLAWPSAELRDAVAYAAASPGGFPGAHDAIAAALPYVTEASLLERLEPMFLQATVARTWIDMRGGADALAMLAAVTALHPGNADDLLHYAQTAVAYASLGLSPERRLHAPSPELARLGERAADDAGHVMAVVHAYWNMIGSYAADEKAERDGPEPQSSESWCHGLQIARSIRTRSVSAETALLSWRDQALAALGEKNAPAEVLASLGQLTGWGVDIRRDLRCVADDVEASVHDPRCRREPMLTIRRDLQVWAGLAGDAEGARVAAAMAFAVAFRSTAAPATRIEALGQLLGYLRIAAAGTPLALVSHGRLRGLPTRQELAGEGAARAVVETAERLLKAISRAAWETPSLHAVTCETVWSRAEAVPESARTAPLTPTNEVDADPRSGLVVLPQLITTKMGNGAELERDWRPMVGRALPLVPVPDLGEVRSTILRRFPHCREVVDRLLADLVGRTSVRIRPTLLVGAPGTGKTTLSRAFLEALGLPVQVYPAGGVADSSLIGTSRQWATARASIPLQLIRQAGTASVAVVIDEIEKAAESPQNGRVENGLLPYLEEATSQAMFDLLLETNVDLSQVSWLATANRLEGLSPALRDRLRVIPVPEPGLEHLPALLPAVLADIAASHGLSSRWIEPLAQAEVDLVERLWRPRSLRRLMKIVGRLLEKRDELQSRH